MNVALVYDRVNKWGGAECVLLALHKLFPSAPLYTAVYDKKRAKWAEVFRVHPSFIQKIPFAKNHHEWYPWLTPLAFESFTFDQYDLVISITSADAKGIITKPQTVHICYCLTPTRYLWSHFHEYFPSTIVRFIFKPIVVYLRKWDKVASHRPDYYIAISRLVQKRIKRFYGLESDVVYPPVLRLMRSGLIQNPDRLSDLPDDFFLVVSRLVRYKKIDIAIQACNILKLPLVIIGSGFDGNRLKSLSGPTIYFTKDLTDWDLAWYYRHSRALIMPQEEDFGIVSVEAQSFGIPVVSYEKSGASETIISNKTGLLYKDQTVNGLICALEVFKRKEFDKEDCIKNAKNFSYQQFEKHLMRTILKLTRHNTQ